MMGSTRNGEKYVSIEVLENILNNDKKSLKYNLMMALYFLYDSQYDNRDLKFMADHLNKTLLSNNK
tara:strand:- start:384 stop:581 length:198 start_codon:yes stop_codon:yes gene_type:complete